MEKRGLRRGFKIYIIQNAKPESGSITATSYIPGDVNGDRVVNGKDVTFADFRFDAEELETALRNYKFSNNRPITRSMLAWYAFTFENQ